jgi:EmrB/QacA subfamily drug resistance transporter
MAGTEGATSKKLVLVAMIFTVSMTFIDQTIVSIAVPEIQDDVGLSATGAQWIVNGYLLSLAALFAFGGRLADIAGHRRMVLIGIAIFAGASALCGATPDGSIAEAWLIVFRVIQGAGAAIMFPAALAIVVAAYPQAERGRALAIFFGVAGGLTALGPLAGGYLIDVTWRAIFWINIPVAIASVVLTLRSRPEDRRRPAPLDYRGTVLFALGMGLLVLGLQQASIWGWEDAKTIASIAVGALLMGAFVMSQLGIASPLIQVRTFADRAFSTDNLVLFLISIAFVPMFLYASMYAQISLGDDASQAGLYLGIFFLGYVIAAQWGGRLLDKQGAKASALPGCAIAAVGFYLWADTMPDIAYSDGGGWWRVALAGAGTGLILGPISTDALNRAPGASYGEVTGITQTARNLGASLGLAVLGTILISENRTNVTDKLTSLTGSDHVPRPEALEIASSVSQQSAGTGESTGHATAAQFQAVQDGFALSAQTVFYVMAAAMAVAFVVALVGLPRGKAPTAEIVDQGEAEVPPPSQPAGVA